MGSPIIWFGNAAKLLKSKLSLPDATVNTVSITAPAAVATYTLTLPNAVAAVNNSALVSSNAGVLSYSPIPAETFQATAGENSIGRRCGIHL
jgi:hypothetical protein